MLTRRKLEYIRPRKRSDIRTVENIGTVPAHFRPFSPIAMPHTNLRPLLSLGDRVWEDERQRGTGLW